MSSDMKKVPDKVVEYLPDALEIKNQKLPGLIKFGVWFPLILVAGAIIWASFAKTDVVVQGGGKLVSDQPMIVMKPLERSVIKEIKVKVGDEVKKGQVLIVFDPAFNRAEADRLKNEIAAQEAHLKRLQAEFLEKKFEDGQDHFIQWQLAIYRQRQEYFKQRMTYFDETLKQIDAMEKSKQDTLSKQNERLEKIRELEGIFGDLYKKKAGTLVDLHQMSITRMEMEAAVDQLANDLLELKHRRGTTLAEKNSFVQEWRNKISEDMVAVDRNLTSTKKEYDKVAQLIEYVELVAPCDAVVHEIASFSPGSAVREAEALITLVPTDGNIELEAEIRPEDIGKVKVESEARIKLSAYPFQKYGTLAGKVKNISEDTLERNVNGVPVKYYRARIKINPDSKLRIIEDKFRLIPGMETQCEIKCDRRRVITYVLYPLIKALDETAREP